jgi:hypothetical protein
LLDGTEVGGAVGVVGLWLGVGPEVGPEVGADVGPEVGVDGRPVGVCGGHGEVVVTVAEGTVSGVGREPGAVPPVVPAVDVAVLVGVAGASAVGVADEEGAVTLTNPGAPSAPGPGASGATRFGAPSRSGDPVPEPCRNPGAAKAIAAMAAVDRLPIAIGAGRSGLNGLRPRWRAL